MRILKRYDSTGLVPIDYSFPAKRKANLAQLKPDLSYDATWGAIAKI